MGQISIPKEERCPGCNGSGRADDHYGRTQSDGLWPCDVCKGSGRKPATKPCPGCGGSGVETQDEYGREGMICKVCRGRGKI